MTVKDEFLFQRTNIVHGDESILTRRCDLSLSSTEADKRNKTINALISFLIQSGFDTQGLLEDIEAFIHRSKNHPDNDDFSMESRIEEHLMDTKHFKEFIENLEESIHSYNEGETDEPNLKDLFRRWLIVAYMENKVEESQD